MFRMTFELIALMARFIEYGKHTAAGASNDSSRKQVIYLTASITKLKFFLFVINYNS